MGVVKIARPAMGTIFEIVVYGENEGYLLSVAEEALDEVERLDRQMSLYNPTSEICWINARAAREAVRVEPRLFRLLQRAARIQKETEGAFDIAILALRRCWQFFPDADACLVHPHHNPFPSRKRGFRSVPEQDAILAALKRTGMKHVVLCEEERTVRFLREGVGIDLSGIGKGYAIEVATQVLQENGIQTALLHGGGSTVFAIGAPPGEKAWRIAITHPTDPKRRIAVFPLKDMALSSSGTYYQSFEANGRRYGHILNPCTGLPEEGILGVTVVCPSPTESDALSTAFFILGIEGARRYCQRHENVGALVIKRADGYSPLY